MLLPSASQLLAAWELGQEQGAVERGLTLLTLACPAASSDSLALLSLGDRDRQLLGLREAIFGPRMTGLSECAQCGKQLELEIATTDLRVPAGDAASLELTDDEYEVRLRLPDSRDLLFAASRLHSAATLLMERCVIAARRNDEDIDPSKLPPALRDRIAESLSVADPLVDIRLGITCTDCDRHWNAPFDIASFLWMEIDAWAIRLLRDVHVLASAYGWAEQEILGLSPTRRRFYLRLLTE